MGTATPVSRARLGFAILVERGLAHPRVASTPGRLNTITTSEAEVIAKTVLELQRRSRAPVVDSFFSDEDLSRLRRCDLLDHVAERLDADTRCVLCMRGESRSRALGRCKVCRVHLCSEHWTSFHAGVGVSDASMGRRLKFED